MPSDSALFFSPNPDIGDRLGSREHRQKRKQKHLDERIGDLAALARIGQAAEKLKKDTASSKAPQSSVELPIVVILTRIRGS